MRITSPLLLAVVSLGLAGCFDSSSDDRSGRYGDRDDRYGDRYDDRYDDRSNDRYSSNDRPNRQPTRYYRESDLVRLGTFSTDDKREKNQLLEIRGGQRFKGILFEVDRGEVVVEHIRVTFDDDSAFEPQVSNRFRDGDQTRLIDLPGNNRDVKRVRVHYRSTSGGNSVITLYGLPIRGR